MSISLCNVTTFISIQGWICLLLWSCIGDGIGPLHKGFSSRFQRFSIGLKSGDCGVVVSLNLFFTVKAQRILKYHITPIYLQSLLLFSSCFVTVKLNHSLSTVDTQDKREKNEISQKVWSETLPRWQSVFNKCIIRRPTHFNINRTALGSLEEGNEKN